MRHKLLEVKFELRSILGQHPLLFFWWRKLYKPEDSSRVETEDTAVVIEGIPHSGNTLAIAAFAIEQGLSVVFARHTHRAVQITVAIQKEIPTLVVTRSTAFEVIDH